MSRLKDFLNETYKNGKVTDPDRIKPVISIIGKHVSESLKSESKSDITAMSETLTDLMLDVLTDLPGSLISELRDSKIGTDLHVVYLLGHLSALQMLCVQEAHNRIDDDFIPNLMNPDIRPAIMILSTGKELTYEDLMLILNKGRKPIIEIVNKLRNSGILEFRMNGNIVMNFLTPAAIISYQNELQNRPKDTT